MFYVGRQLEYLRGVNGDVVINMALLDDMVRSMRTMVIMHVSSAILALITVLYSVFC